MGYYGTGDYYRGDYYRTRRQAGGLGSFLGTVARGILGALPGGPIISQIPGVISGIRKSPTATGIMRKVTAPIAPMIPGGIGSTIRDRMYPEAGGGGGVFMGRRRRRMNPANPKALRRAVRREAAFVGLAKRVLRGTGITVSRHRFGSKTKRKR